MGYAHAQTSSSSPPMGWSAWDAYGASVSEADFRANAAQMAKLRSYGWQYAMLDYGWYIAYPENAHSSKTYAWDASGRLIPEIERFPSADGGKGFKPLADWLHARGLKLGIHVMLGLPRQVVELNLPIAGSAFHATEAADAQTCSWDGEFQVVKDNAAGQAYYDSIARLYADWGVDLIKLGCVADHPFHASEIRQMSLAIRKSGRAMLLSLSPGPLPADYLAHVTDDAQMWRIAPEHWDTWRTPPGSNGFPVGLREEFDLLAQAAGETEVGGFIDPDALADGWLAPHPPWGGPRYTRLTQEEQRSEIALWAFARAPLIEGANLTRTDRSLRRLMTQRDLIGIDQHSLSSVPIQNLPADLKSMRVWVAHTSDRSTYVGFFNLDDQRSDSQVTWKDLGLAGQVHRIRNVWTGRHSQSTDGIQLNVSPHGCVVFQVD